MFSKRVVSESDAVMEAGWKRRSSATAPPGASQRIAHGDEAPQARGIMGMHATIVFVPYMGRYILRALYCGAIAGRENPLKQLTAGSLRLRRFVTRGYTM